MKRTIAIILLIIGGVLACGLGILGLAAPFVLTSGLNPLCILSLAVHTVAAVFVQGLYQRRGWLNALNFWAYSGVPALIIGIVLKIVDVLRSGTWYFTDELVSVAAALLIIYPAVFLALFGIWLLGSAPARKDKSS